MSRTFKLNEELGRTTDSLMHNLHRMLVRLDNKLGKIETQRGKVQEFLEIKEDIDLSFTKICEAVGSLRMAIKSKYVGLLDAVNRRIVIFDRYTKPIEKDKMLINRIVKAKLNIIMWFRLAFYELLKIQAFNEEIRDEKYENSGLGIARDIEPLYDGGFGREVRKRVDRGDSDAIDDVVKDEEQADKPDDQYF